MPFASPAWSPGFIPCNGSRQRPCSELPACSAIVHIAQRTVIYSSCCCRAIWTITTPEHSALGSTSLSPPFPFTLPKYMLDAASLLLLNEYMKYSSFQHSAPPSGSYSISQISVFFRPSPINILTRRPQLTGPHSHSRSEFVNPLSKKSAKKRLPGAFKLWIIFNICLKKSVISAEATSHFTYDTCISPHKICGNTSSESRHTGAGTSPST